MTKHAAKTASLQSFIFNTVTIINKRNVRGKKKKRKHEK